MLDVLGVLPPYLLCNIPPKSLHLCVRGIFFSCIPSKSWYCGVLYVLFSLFIIRDPRYAAHDVAPCLNLWVTFLNCAIAITNVEHWEKFRIASATQVNPCFPAVWERCYVFLGDNLLKLSVKSITIIPLNPYLCDTLHVGCYL